MNDKAYQISYTWDEEVLTVVITGQASKDNAMEIAQCTLAISERYRPQRILVDCTNLAGRLGIGDTYFHVRDYPQECYRAARVAVLDHPENEYLYSFFETTAQNAGVNIRCFTDGEEAKRWLLQAYP